MQIIVLADGDVGPRPALDAAWPGWLDPGARVVAADGGARHGDALGLRIDRWVGDGDSLGESGIEALAAQGIAIERAPTDKDESDTELALGVALELAASRVTILGALGGPRLDHALANLALLTMPSLAGVEVVLLAVDVRVRLLQSLGPADDPDADDPDALVGLALQGLPGGLVSLLPVGDDVVGVSTEGLAYPLVDEPLLLGRTRGLSNVLLGDRARVTLRHGRLLVIETPARLGA